MLPRLKSTCLCTFTSCYPIKCICLWIYSYLMLRSRYLTLRWLRSTLTFTFIFVNPVLGYLKFICTWTGACWCIRVGVGRDGAGLITSHCACTLILILRVWSSLALVDTMHASLHLRLISVSPVFSSFKGPRFYNWFASTNIYIVYNFHEETRNNMNNDPK